MIKIGSAGRYKGRTYNNSFFVHIVNVTKILKLGLKMEGGGRRVKNEFQTILIPAKYTNKIPVDLFWRSRTTNTVTQDIFISEEYYYSLLR